MMPYAVVIVAWCRPRGLRRLVGDVIRQRPAPAEVVVWHNGDTLDVPAALNLRAGRNLGCRVRHAVGLMLEVPAVVYIDDDVALAAESVCPDLVTAVELSGGLVGWRGRLLAPTARPYSDGCDAQRAGAAHVVKGIIHAAPRMLAPESLCDPESRQHDDIDLSAACLMSTGKLPQLIELERGALAVVREADGYEDRSAHWSERDDCCMRWMGRGWRPFNGGGV
jgi:hypothetical protein